MVHLHGSTLGVIGFALAIIAGGIAACSDDGDLLGARAGRGTSDVTGDGGVAEAGASTSGAAEEVMFRALEPDLQKKCGGACHDQGTYKPPPPLFLAGPDTYKSIKSYNGIVTRDVYQSALLTKGAHAGPAVNADPDFEKRVIAWLEAESLAIKAQKLPTTDAVTVAQGANDLDLSKACASGLTGVHLKFDASLVGGMLSLSNMKLVAPAGTDVHLLRPSFIRVLAAPRPDGTKEVRDSADTFSNTDQTVPGGQETTLAPGTAFFSGDGWRPFDLAADKIRIEVERLEPGKVQVISAPQVCKDVQAFTNNVLPALKGNGFNPNCASCHGNGLAGLSLNDADNALVCSQVLTKLNKANIAQSVIVTKVAPGGNHGGGAIDDPTAWTQLWTSNAGAFF